MPTLAKHKQQLDINKNFFSDISKEFNTKYFDWKITTLFYEIVHCAEALGAKYGEHHENHGDREAFLRKKLDKSDFNAYRQLKNASRLSRYEAQFLTKAASAYCIQLYQKSYKPLREAFDNKYLP